MEYISNFTCARYYFLYVEFSDFYVNQSLAGQTIVLLLNNAFYLILFENKRKYNYIFLKFCVTITYYFWNSPRWFTDLNTNTYIDALVAIN
jgi:hypothetical protein